MTQLNLFQLHMSSLQHSCIALSGVADNVFSDQTLARNLSNLAGRLPGPLAEQAGPRDPLSVQQALPLLSSARASIHFLSKTGRFSDLGLRIAEGLFTCLSTLETRLGQQLRAEIQHRIRGLYVIIDPLVTGGREPQHIAAEALEGGATILQLRDKTRDKGQTLGLAHTLKAMCDQKGALLIINDHADLAADVNAHGVHVGQEDLPVSAARKVLGPQQIVGRSNHLYEEALNSQAQGADYVAVGAMYPTVSKDQPIVGGLPLLRAVKKSAAAPVVAIGGITEDRVQDVVRAGADAICVIGAIGLAPSPRDATRRMVEAITRAGGKA